MEQTKEVIERVIDRLHEEARQSQSDTKIFAVIAREYSLQIQTMREEGYSYIEIYSAFEKENLLPEKANIDSFRQACRRQLRRQVTKEVHRTQSKDALSLVTKKLVEKQEKGALSQVTTAQHQDAEALEKERRKKLGLDKGINTPSGMIIKDAEGGFEF